MISKIKVPKFLDYIEFYEKLVIAFKKVNPEAIRLDNQISGGTRKAIAWFVYNESYWKVDSDTLIEKLDKVYTLIKTGQDPFIICPTKGGKSKCLTINGQPKSPKKFYVYLIGKSS